MPQHGCLAKVSVRDWLEQHQAVIAQLPYVLISSMDSDRMVSDMPWAVARREQDPQWALSTSPLVISGTATVTLLDDSNLFAGFDELWIPSQLPVANPPDEAFLVAPRELDGEAPVGVLRWVQESGCRLGVGDGEGLNFVGDDLGLAASLGLT